MISAIVMNVLGAVIIVGIWTAAVVHTHRAVERDQRRAPAVTSARRPSAGFPAASRARTLVTSRS